MRCLLCRCASQGAPNPTLLITEVCPCNREYIEIYNPGDQAVRLRGYQWGYYPSNHTSWLQPWRFKAFPDSAVIEPHRYFLVTLGEGGAAPQGDWNAYSSAMLRADGGAVALFYGEPERGDIVDAIGWGDSALCLGSAAKPPAPGGALTRNPGASREEPFLNSGNNRADFSATTPGPSCGQLGVVAILEDAGEPQDSMRARTMSIFNASSTMRAFSLLSHSSLGYAVDLQPSNLNLMPGEWGTVEWMPKPHEYVVMDLETSGLSPMIHDIIEVAWIHVLEGDVVQSRSSLIFLGQALDPLVTQITGITSEMLASAPEAADVIPEVLTDIVGFPVLSYSTNAFDPRFLEATVTSLGLQMPAIDWIDAFAWTKQAFPELAHHGLADVAEHLGIHERHHRALPDAMMTNQVFQEVLLRLSDSLDVTVRIEHEAVPVGVLHIPVDPR